MNCFTYGRLFDTVSYYFIEMIILTLCRMAPNDTAYKRWSCYSDFGKLLWKLSGDTPTLTWRPFTK